MKTLEAAHVAFSVREADIRDVFHHLYQAWLNRKPIEDALFDRLALCLSELDVVRTADYDESAALNHLMDGSGGRDGGCPELRALARAGYAVDMVIDGNGFQIRGKR